MRLEGVTQHALDTEVARLVEVVGLEMKNYPMREVVTEIYAELVYDPDRDIEMGTDWLEPFVDEACERLRAAGMASFFADGGDG
jgi:hypothetical protein